MDQGKKAQLKAKERLLARVKARKDIGLLYQQLILGDRNALATAITLCESTATDDQIFSRELIQNILPHTGKAKRIGITGVPGVGKSTFIEQFGLNLIAAKHKVAVLAIDPSSQRTKGSILGDKTRMEMLSNHEQAFIRPSPANDALGGVAARTREAMLLCEAAGYDVILIETVGVGQSEIAVRSMVDYFLLLMLAGAGDELQGIKRGIMEMADGIAITKVDGENTLASKRAKAEYKNALHLFPPAKNQWSPQVFLTSAYENIGLDEVKNNIDLYFKQLSENGYLQTQRKEQNIGWFDNLLREGMLQAFLSQEGKLQELKLLREAVASGNIDPQSAAKKLLSL
ncbi:MAG: methylmalonyl Co-A mutase-associated GTPase MeaB [Flavobacteriales bacterium]|nr:methylmalonyl Co-A mutase-associated GTPase MeaB [Flavobacteriales bacterium]MDG1766890.1 methylmalonyl Co-A mutase-associated GTPase MeaB [Flavobacteriales bacterium]